MGLPNGIGSGIFSGYDGLLSKLLYPSWSSPISYVHLYWNPHLTLIMQGCSHAWNKIEKRIATLEFDRDRKSMGVIVNSSTDKKSLLVKVHIVSLPCSHNLLLLFLGRYVHLCLVWDGLFFGFISWCYFFLWWKDQDLLLGGISSVNITYIVRISMWIIAWCVIYYNGFFVFYCLYVLFTNPKYCLLCRVLWRHCWRGAPLFNYLMALS